ncbi:MAG TPA: hypothetical protein VJ787_12790 [Thermoleophilia bacterium]|nr:hypothetical protein [Thermoleophilia bacterium]
MRLLGLRGRCPHLRLLRRLAGFDRRPLKEDPVHDTADDAADDREDDEDPELRERAYRVT